jgi:hypothetical protein
MGFGVDTGLELRQNKNMNTTGYYSENRTNTNTNKVSQILDTMTYSFEREAFLKSLALKLVAIVDTDELNAAIIEATYFRED